MNKTIQHLINHTLYGSNVDPSPISYPEITIQEAQVGELLAWYDDQLPKPKIVKVARTNKRSVWLRDLADISIEISMPVRDAKNLSWYRLTEVEGLQRYVDLLEKMTLHFDTLDPENARRTREMAVMKLQFRGL